MKGHSRTVVSLSILLALVLLSSALTGCSTRAPRKRSFMGSSSPTLQDTEISVGLNPLGSLDICLGTLQPMDLSVRVLVSRPEHFTRNASDMVLRLREGLIGPSRTEIPIELMLTERSVRSRQEALSVGRACGAFVVLWERGSSQFLEMDFPFPTRIPLKNLDQSSICAYGSANQRLNVMYYTILGTAALLDHRYERAQYHLGLANAIDLDCLKLPGRSGILSPG